MTPPSTVTRSQLLTLTFRPVGGMLSPLDVGRGAVCAEQIPLVDRDVPVLVLPRRLVAAVRERLIPDQQVADDRIPAADLAGVRGDRNGILCVAGRRGLDVARIHRCAEPVQHVTRLSHRSLLSSMAPAPGSSGPGARHSVDPLSDSTGTAFRPSRRAKMRDLCTSAKERVRPTPGLVFPSHERESET